MYRLLFLIFLIFMFAILIQTIINIKEKFTNFIIVVCFGIGGYLGIFVGFLIANKIIAKLES